MQPISRLPAVAVVAVSINSRCKQVYAQLRHTSWCYIIYDAALLLITIGGVFLLPIDMPGKITLLWLAVPIPVMAIIILHQKILMQDRNYLTWLFAEAFGITLLIVGMNISPKQWHYLVLIIHGQMQQVADNFESDKSGNILIGIGLTAIYVGMAGLIRLLYIRILEKTGIRVYTHYPSSKS